MHVSGGARLWNPQFLHTSDLRELDLGSGYTAYRRVSLINLYLQTKCCSNQKTLWTDGGIDIEIGLNRSTRRSRPNNNNNLCAITGQMFTRLPIMYILGSLLSSDDIVDSAASGRQPSDQANPHGPVSFTIYTRSPFIIINQPEGWYAFHRSTEGRGLSRPGVAVYIPQWFSCLQMVTHSMTFLDMYTQQH